MEIVSRQCVNSKWPADFLADSNEECCECFGQCKVRVKSSRGYVYILAEHEIDDLKHIEETWHA